MIAPMPSAGFPEFGNFVGLGRPYPAQFVGRVSAHASTKMLLVLAERRAKKDINKNISNPKQESAS
jgi:hypothetical protein